MFIRLALVLEADTYAQRLIGEGMKSRQRSAVQRVECRLVSTSANHGARQIFLEGGRVDASWQTHLSDHRVSKVRRETLHLLVKVNTIRLRPLVRWLGDRRRLAVSAKELRELVLERHASLAHALRD